MELFLLLSMGFSIVAFLSVAINQSPASQSISELNLDQSIQLRHSDLSPEKINSIKLGEQALSQEYEVLGIPREPIQVQHPAVAEYQKEKLAIAAAF